MGPSAMNCSNIDNPTAPKHGWDNAYDSATVALPPFYGQDEALGHVRISCPDA